MEVHLFFTWESWKPALKGTVHLKMKILSSFTHPQVDPNLYECVCSEHKGRYSEEWGTQSSVFSSTIEVNGAPKQLITNFLQNIFVCVQNKHIHTGLIYLRMSNWWQNFHFWVYCPFKWASALKGLSLTEERHVYRLWRINHKHTPRRC